MQLIGLSWCLRVKLIRGLFCGCIGLAFFGEKLMPKSSLEIDIKNLAYIARVPFLISIYQSLAFPILIILVIVALLLRSTRLGEFYTLAISGLIVLVWLFSFLCVVELTAV
jgi:hypothetical protein